MVRIKICGLRTVEDALFCAQMGADAVGFVFAESARRVEMEAARCMAAALPPFVQRIGVFVDAEKEWVERAANCIGLSALQFHGHEDADYCRSFTLPVIKAVRVRNKADLEGLKDHPAAAVLLDTYDPLQAGGTGRAFDWSLAAGWLGKPVVLAGGLHAGNVAEAVKQVRPYAVDVSSGVESNGNKDQAKIQAFIAAVRRCA